MERLTIGERINEVRKQVDYIQKTKKVRNYKGTEHDVVTATVRPELVKYGIVMETKLIEGELREAGKSENGAQAYIYVGVFQVDFCCADKPEERMTCIIPGSGMDFGDKAPGTATSYAVKIAILKMFNIETGESDESRFKTEITITDETKNKILEYQKNAGTSDKDLNKWLSGWLKVGSVNDLTEKQGKMVLNQIKSKVEHQKNVDMVKETFND
jgi:hypothetical protein